MTSRPLSRLDRVVLGLALLLACSTADDLNFVTIRDAVVDVEIVETPESQRRGLGERDGLAWDDGMLFVYETPRSVAIWMKAMRFDIDIVWIHEGRIIDMAWRVPHDVPESLPVYRPRSPADMVLEVPAGYAEAQGWRIGDRIKLERARRPTASTPR